MFGDNNIRGAKAGTDLRMVWQAVQAPLKAGIPILQQLGLSADELGRTMEHHGLSAALQQFVHHLQESKVPVGDWGQYVTDIFGKRAGVGIGIMVDQLARLKSKFPDLEHGASGFGAAWKAQQKTVGQQWKDLESGLEALDTKMGTMLLPTAMKVVHWLSEFTEDLEKGKAPALALAGVVGGLLATTALGKLASGVKGVAGNIKTLWEGGEAGAKFLASGTSTLFSGIKSAAGSAASGISSLIGKLSGAAGATEELSGATEEEAIAQGEADAAMDANPIGAIIIAIALLGAGIYEVVKHWKDFKQWGLDAFHFVEHAGEDVLHWIEHNWPYLLGILLGPIALATAIIYKHWDTIKNGAEEAWHFVSHVVAEGWDDVVHDTEHFADEMTAGAEHLWHDLENWWDDGMNDIHDAEVRGFDDVMSLFRSLPGRVLSAVAGFGHLLWNAGADLVHGLISGIESMVGDARPRGGEPG